MIYRASGPTVAARTQAFLRLGKLTPQHELPRSVSVGSSLVHANDARLARLRRLFHEASENETDERVEP
jgi:hypothetical protein